MLKINSTLLSALRNIFCKFIYNFFEKYSSRYFLLIFRRHIEALLFIFIAMPYALAFEIGAGIHLGQNRPYSNLALPSLRMLDFSSFRDEIYWHRIENDDGVLDVSKGPAPLLSLLRKPRYSHSSMLVLAYGHPSYDGASRPMTSGAIEGFKRYAVAVAKSVPEAGYLEIWNEWNHVIGVPQRTKGDASGYLRLVEDVAPALRDSGSKSKIVVGALADDYPDWAFAKQLVSGGILTHADYFSVHLYNYSEGRNAVPAEMFSRLSRLQKILTDGNGGKPFPVLVTEFGWPTHLGKRGISESRAGDYVSQFFLLAPSFSWLKGAWVYELFDSGTTDDAVEHNFGQLKADGKPKQGMCKVRGAIKILRNSSFIKSERVDKNVQWLVYKVGARFFNIFFTIEKDVEKRWSVKSGNISVLDFCQYASAGDSAEENVSTFFGVSNQPRIIVSDEVPLIFSELLVGR